MKQTYYLLILLLISLVSCENRHIKHYERDLYFYNELEDHITLKIFKEGEASKYELTQNDSIFWTTIHWSADDRYNMFEIPIENQVYASFLYLIDSVSIHYNSNIYIYSNNDSIEGLFYYLQGDRNNIIYFDELKKKTYGLE